MGKVSESIWSNGNVIIPMAEVSHIAVYGPTADASDRIGVFLKHSKWSAEAHKCGPMILLRNESAISFKKDWCTYRSELESETLTGGENAY